MSAETTIAASIRIAKDTASYDACCKRLLSEKRILAHLMKVCLPEYLTLTAEDIAAHYIEETPQTEEIGVYPDETNTSKISGENTEDNSLNEGRITYDIRFFASAPAQRGLSRLLLNVEAQNEFYPGYPLSKRGLYYCGRMLSAQYGTEFTGSHYEKLKKVCSIWICMNPPKYRQNTINGYEIMEKNIVGNIHDNEENYKLLSLFLICLGNPEGAQKGSALRLLDVLLSRKLLPGEKKRLLEEEFKLPMDSKMESEVSRMCNLGKGIWLEGIEHGRQDGFREGEEKSLLSSIQNLMETLTLTAEQAMNALKIPETERSKYFSKLKL